MNKLYVSAYPYTHTHTHTHTQSWLKRILNKDYEALFQEAERELVMWRILGSSHWGRSWAWLLSVRMWVQSLALLSELRIHTCHELRCRWQTRLGSHIAVAVVEAGSCSSNSTPSLGTTTCHRCGYCRMTLAKGLLLIKFEICFLGVPVVSQWLTNPD